MEVRAADRARARCDWPVETHREPNRLAVDGRLDGPHHHLRHHALLPAQPAPAPLPTAAAMDAEGDMFQTELDFGSIEGESFTRDVYQRCARAVCWEP